MSEAAELAAELRRLELFSALEEEQLHAVVAAARVVRVDAERAVFEQGQSAERFFWLRRGLMKLSRLSAAGEEKVIEFVQPGQTFAEALMFAGEASVYPVTARAIEASELIAIDNRPVVALLRRSPESCLRLLAVLSRRMHGLLAEIDRLSLQSATMRVAGFLLSNDAAGRVALRTSKHLLAARLSITPETLSRVFARLGTAGLVRVNGPEIELVDAAELQRLVESGEV